MPATVTLATTTLAADVAPSDRQVKLASTAGVLPGMALYVNNEMMHVVSLGIDPAVNVIRGMGGTKAELHVDGLTVYIGRRDQFYSHDPVGTPTAVIHVSPHINTANGSVWFAMGEPAEGEYRYWQKQTVTYGVGPLGVRTVTYDPTAST